MMTDQQLLDIQANILINHGRTKAWFLFLQFKFNPNNQDYLRRWVSKFSERVSSAYGELEAYKIYKAQQKLRKEYQQKDFDKKTFTCFFLSANGYRKLGYTDDQMPEDLSFRLGMQKGRLGDPPTICWESYYQEEIDAMILLANKDEAVLANEHIKIAESLMMANVGIVLFVEKGSALLSGNKNSTDRKYIEHFGYRDGISNSDFFDKHGSQFDGKEEIVLDKKNGSYLVFRKLEQNVRAFNQQVGKLAKYLCIKKEYVEAQIIGRFKDGTPLELSYNDGLGPENEFDFNNDPKGKRCPFHAHIRKVRPRVNALEVKTKDGTIERIDPENIRIVRRGITYGFRATDLSDEPEEGVGLLFMSYQQSIRNQFEHIQKEWCNNKDFISPRFKTEKVTGIDPIIGVKVTGIQTQLWNTNWLIPGSINTRNMQTPNQAIAQDAFPRRSFRHVVTMKGGEYLYAPSISSLKNLTPPQTETMKEGKKETKAGPQYTPFNIRRIGSNYPR